MAREAQRARNQPSGRSAGATRGSRSCSAALRGSFDLVGHDAGSGSGRRAGWCSRRRGALPATGPVVVEALHPVLESDPLRRAEADRRVVDFELALARRRAAEPLAHRRDGRPPAPARSARGVSCRWPEAPGTIRTAPFVLGNQISPVRGQGPRRLDAAVHLVGAQPLRRPDRRAPPAARRPPWGGSRGPGARPRRHRSARSSRDVLPLSSAMKWILLLGKPRSMVNWVSAPPLSRNRPAPCVPIHKPPSGSS